MFEIKCPECGKIFKIDESDYDLIVKQIRNKEFNEEIKKREEIFLKEKESALELKKIELEKTFLEKQSLQDLEIAKLNNVIKSANENKENEINKKVSEKDLEIEKLKSKVKLESAENEIKIKNEVSKKDELIASLNNKIKLMESENKLNLNNELFKKNKEITDLSTELKTSVSEHLLKEKSLKETYEVKLKIKDEEILYYKDFKAKQSTKMIGESLELHCQNEFNKLRPLFKNCYFEKDNDSKTGSKGDYIFRNISDDIEVTSIMFEMKNEADMTSTKHKNEDFLKELDKDRCEKNCEYAVLVSLLEIDNEYYNNGIVDVSHKYPKMYIIRPQMFIPLITLICNLSEKALEYKKELNVVRNQNIDISNFEENMNLFKDSFGRNYRLASDKFNNAIAGIDKTIAQLEKTKKDLLSSENNLRLANDKANDLSIKKLTSNSPTVRKMFEEEKNNQ